jgi:hypothetical protein
MGRRQVAGPFEQKDADRPSHGTRRDRPPKITVRRDEGDAVVIDQVVPEPSSPEPTLPAPPGPLPGTVLLPEQRVVPEEGGHVTVRVVGFDEHGRRAAPACDALGRLSVRLQRDGDHVVRVVSLDGDELGVLPEPWNRNIERELARCEADGVDAVARATLTGPRDARDLCVLLGWPAGRRRTSW